MVAGVEVDPVEINDYIRYLSWACREIIEMSFVHTHLHQGNQIKTKVT